MPIIDLETGELTDEQPIQQALQPDLQVAEEDKTQGRIIDLDTGEFVQPQTAAQIQQTAQPLPEGNFVDAITAPIKSIAAQAITAPIAGFAGIGSSLANQDATEGGQFVRDIQTAVQEITAPQTQAGQKSLQTIGDLVQSGVDIANFPISGLGGLLELISGQGIDQAAQTVRGIQKKGLGKTLGSRVLEETGSPVAATVAETLPAAGFELAGFKGLRNVKSSTPRERSKVVQSEAERKAALIAGDVAEKTGIDLFPAQQTLNPTDIERQSFVAQLPEGAVRAREQLGIQNKQALDAVDSVLNQLAPAESVGGAAIKFRSAAQKSVEAIKQIRREVASPIYKQAFRRQRQGKIGLIDTKSLELKISEMSKQFDQKGQVAKNLNIALDKIRRSKGDLQKLHNSKLEIDQIINAFGDGAIGNTTKRFMTDVIGDLTNELTKQSPSYRAAKSEFERLSPAVNKIQDSPIGQIANFDDVQLKQISQKIFTPGETNPAVIARAKEVITEVDPQAWDIIVRAELERRMGRIKADLGDTTNISAVENVPSQLFESLFGNKKNRDVLFNSVNGETKKNLKYLETALRRASKGRPGGSQTGVRAEISRELKGGMFQSLRDFFRSPINTAAGIGEEAAFNARVRAMSDVLFDPTWKDDMKELRSLSPESSKSKRVMDRILNAALITAPAIEIDQGDK